MAAALARLVDDGPHDRAFTVTDCVKIFYFLFNQFIGVPHEIGRRLPVACGLHGMLGAD